MIPADSAPRPHGRPEPSAASHLMILLVAGLIFWALTCGLWDLQGPDEGRYVQVAKELLGRANWLVLTVGGDLYDEKLPPPFWVLAAMLKLGGGEPSAWLLRLPAVFAAIATVLMTYLIGRKLHGWRAGWVAAWVLMATPLFMGNAPEAKLDMIFTGFVTLSLAAWLTADRDGPLSIPRAAWMWCALAAAIFYKGPLAIIIVLSVLGAEARAKRSWRVLGHARAQWGFLFLILFFVGWYLLQKKMVGGQFVGTQLEEQTIQRFFRGTHGAPFWYYPPRLIGMFFPWVFLLIPIAIDLWRRRRVPDAVRPAFAWFVIPFIVLSIASGKRQQYMLPLMPPLALMVGWWLAPRLSKARAPKWARTWAPAALIATGVALPAFYFILRFAPKLADMTHMSPSLGVLGMATLLGVLIVLCGLWIRMRSADPPRLFAAVAATMLLVGFSNFICLEPARNPYDSARPFSARIDQEMRSRGLRTLGGVDSAAKAEFYIYAHYPAKRFDEKELRGKKPMSGPLTDMLVVDESDLKRLAPILARERYKLLFTQSVSGDELRVYLRN